MVRSNINYTGNFSQHILKPAFNKLISYGWKLGLGLILVFGAFRFILVMYANTENNYGPVSWLFIIMAVTPFLLLSKEGRRYIGIRKPASYKWLFISFISGAFACLLIFLLFNLLYKQDIRNAFIYIPTTYSLPESGINDDNRQAYFLIFSVIGMTFSPIGEELFYRGVVHGCFASRLGEHKGSVIDSLAFAITHLSHFGIIYIAGVWKFLLFPSLIWISCMYIASRIFFICKQRTGSILGAVSSHAGYNFIMMYIIFYHIL